MQPRNSPGADVLDQRKDKPHRKCWIIGFLKGNTNLRETSQLHSGSNCKHSLNLIKCHAHKRNQKHLTRHAGAITRCCTAKAHDCDFLKIFKKSLHLPPYLKMLHFIKIWLVFLLKEPWWCTRVFTNMQGHSVPNMMHTKLIYKYLYLKTSRF